MKSLINNILSKMHNSKDYKAIGTSKDEAIVKKKFEWLINHGTGESRAKEILNIFI